MSFKRFLNSPYVLGGEKHFDAFLMMS